jgi:inhibitor of cysteine peptidase
VAGLLVTKAQDGQVIRASVGDRVALELPENPTTGYKWAFAFLDEARLIVESSDYLAMSPAVGSGGVERWTFRARAPGAARIELKHLRPWQGDGSIIERFGLTLDIKAQA